jgi:hypothetical protein
MNGAEMCLRLTLLFVAALFVTSCVRAQIADLRKRCDFTNDPRFEVLRGKFPLNPSENENPPTLAEISNNGHPTASERNALLQLDQEGSFCAREALNIIAANAPDTVVGLSREGRLAIVNQQKLLVEGQITYGQYRANSYQILARVQQIGGEYTRAQQIANATNQQAAAAQLSSSMQMLQAFNRQPTISTCNAIGSGVSCISR